MKKILATILFLLLIVSANALCTKRCYVSYQTRSGWSKYYWVKVNFMTGSELNDATNSFRYSSFSNYAVIFWDQGECSIIKISTMLLTSWEFDCSVLDLGIGDLKGTDQDGDSWKLCAYDNEIEFKSMYLW